MLPCTGEVKIIDFPLLLFTIKTRSDLGTVWDIVNFALECMSFISGLLPDQTLTGSITQFKIPA